MPHVQTVAVSEFKAKCLNILDRLANHDLKKVIITKRGRIVGVITPPESPDEPARDLYGCMRGTVIIPDGYDLTDSVLTEPLDAELGILHQ
jgi:antitoxin (DNA-binding transcriptional repressor) of toxin-antitoxin stability system